MSIKIFDSELKILEILWQDGDKTAGALAAHLKGDADIGWSRNTTYTVINKLIDKGGIERYGNNFSCKALVTREEIQEFELAELLEKLFDGEEEKLQTTLHKICPKLGLSAAVNNISPELMKRVPQLKEQIAKIKERWQIVN